MVAGDIQYFTNLHGMLIGSIFDAGRMLTVTANCKEGPPVVEGFVICRMMSLSFMMLVIYIAVLIGPGRSIRRGR